MRKLTKNAFYLGTEDGDMTASEAEGRIYRMINAAPGMSFTERSQLTAGVAQLNPQDIMTLARSMAGLSGAAVGALIARFLMNKGLLGTVLGAIFGGSIANALFGNSLPKNDLGMPSMQGRSLTGEYLRH